ncbi:MAG: ABC transporter permease [Bacteroidetes bacterium]|nr:ABC transporter permease [Bacteroidota bacterium]
MIQYILKRLFYGVLVLFGVITVIFLLFNVLPGDPARMMLGQRADIASVEAINHDLGLDQPLHKQYVGFLNDLSPISIHNYKNEKSFWYLDSEKYSYGVLLTLTNQKWVIKKPYLRRSYQTKRRVSEILAEAFPKTMLLASVSIIFAVVLGIFMGVIIVVKKNNFIEKISMVFSVLGMSLPSFFVAIIFAWVFAFLLADITGLSMFGSLYTVDDLGRGVYLDLKNLILPAITLGIRPLAIVVELTKSSLQDVLSQDFIRTAKAKGLSQYKIITRHAMRNAMNPVITAVSGWFASLMAGAVFVEYVFDWKGVGVVIVDALEKYDFPVIMGAVLVISILLVIINIMVDIIYAFLDPRVRYT